MKHTAKYYAVVYFETSYTKKCSLEKVQMKLGTDKFVTRDEAERWIASQPASSQEFAIVPIYKVEQVPEDAFKPTGKYPNYQL